MRSLRPSLTVSILAFLSSLLLMTWLLFSLFAFRTAAKDLYDQKARHGRMLLATFVSQLPEQLPTYPEGLISPNTPAAVYGYKLSEDNDTIRLTLLDSKGKYIYTSGREGSDLFGPFSGFPQGGEGRFISSDGDNIGVVMQVVRSGNVAGRAGLLLSLEAEKARLRRSRELFMAYFVIDFVLLMGIGAYILSRIVVRPVSNLLAATEKITRGHYGQQVSASGSLEMAQLADAFNDMSETLMIKDRQVNSHVTALEKANRELIQAREESLRSEKMASIGLLAAGMAHEVGTPLSSVLGYAELLAAEQPAGSSGHDYAERITQECGRIDRIIRGLLDFSRPRRAALEDVNIGQLVDETLELVDSQGAMKQIEVVRRYDQKLPPAHVDPHQLQQALINLFLNSRDAMPQGGRLEITVAADQDDSRPVGRICLRIDVSDSGAGITPEDLGRIFDPFFTTKPPGRGTGLGLAIVSRIVEGIGGRISVRSKPGIGTCFTLRLPAVVQEGGLT
ncbi:MAG TPA: ATP-binding protein [Deltaproteobacteria bacterium]|nr:ATP-binding protein [Deltaproteobacteria bacterium]